MAPEQITALAREFSKEHDDSTIAYHAAKDVINFLLRRFCLVEKSKAAKLCRLTFEHGDSVDYGLIDGLTDIVCEIFPEQYQQVAE